MDGIPIAPPEARHDPVASALVIDWERLIAAGVDVPANPMRWSIGDFGSAYAAGAVDLVAIEAMARWAS